MLDFVRIITERRSNGRIDVKPKFVMKKSKDLMIRGADFYAVWVESRGLWSTDEQDVIDLVDSEIDKFVEDNKATFESNPPIKHYMWDSSSGAIDDFHKYCQRQMRDNFHQLDEKLIFANTKTTREDYSSKRLPYPLEDGDISAYERLVDVLYDRDERAKLEWAIGSIVSGDSKTIQKFVVLYGSAGTGKSTVLNIIQQLFEGYYSVFDARALGSASNSFALEAFKTNPLVAIQHDGDLSRIEDNTRLNSLISHEMMTVNEKFKATYSNRFVSFLFMGTNKPVKITDAKSGLIRRLIDISPTGEKLTHSEYTELTSKIKFELGGIAKHCLDFYKDNPNRYDNYRPTRMMGASNDFYNFILDAYFTFKDQDSTTLKVAWEMYKTYCEEARVSYPMPRRQFREELKNYFNEFKDFYTKEDGERLQDYFYGFRTENLNVVDMSSKKDKPTSIIELKNQASIFDKEYANCLAQYAKDDGTPRYSWDTVRTKLCDIDTEKLHYVRVPANHIVIDFDIPNESGEKDLKKNLEEASKWPKTYTELSKSGSGVHLHYIYTGDPEKLSRLYKEHVEVKVFSGKSSLRRKLTKCNDAPIATISSGLPLKEEKVVNFDTVKDEKHLRRLIKNNLNKQYHPNTKPSIDFISKLLDDAYASGMKYDVSDMHNSILIFAANSSHQADYCLTKVSQMKFKSEEPSEFVHNDDKPIVFFDVEVFPNLLVIVWKGEDTEKCVKMINPTPSEVESLLKYRLVGFNNRKYDNHILYGRLIGYSCERLFQLSQDMIERKTGFFGEAYNISFTDIYDFAAKKQSLKKWEIELGIHHDELGLPWDKPVDESLWFRVAEYCAYDVMATEAVWKHCKGDFTAREILANLAGMTVNDTTNSLTTRIIFGKERNPQLIYTDLATGKTSDPSYQRTDIITAFPGYEFVNGKNMFRGEEIGKGGYIRSWPGIYENVGMLDIASLHPNSIIAMNCFGKYTQHFKDILDARIYIKHGEYDKARHMLNGKIAPFLEDESTAKDLAQALKIAINSVYGLTAAGFDNPFRDIRNKNNIVALRGGLFMKSLQDEVESRGYKIVAIKTDSIKIADIDDEIIKFCMDFASKYGYTFEYEANYKRICEINDADYIAKYSDMKDINGSHCGEWTATGAQFQVPYVMKTLFTHEPITFDDMCETKSVKSALYLDMNERIPQHPDAKKELAWRDKQEKDDKSCIIYRDPTFSNTTDDELRRILAETHNYIFVGKVGRFTPIKPGCGGGVLVREQNGKYHAATGTKGYRWLESEMVRNLEKENDIDVSYYKNLVDKAVNNISKYGDFEAFIA